MAFAFEQFPQFAQYDEVIGGDTEFIHGPGELYDQVSLAYKELRSGRSDSLWCDELGSEPPHAHGPNVLFVGFTGAEPEFYHSMGWGFDCAFLDLRVEGILQTNLALPRGHPRRERLPRSLIQFLRVNGIKDGDEALKDAMRKRILQGFPFTTEERCQILKYCLSDVLLLLKLLEVLAPRIVSFQQALMRGEYVKFCAEIFGVGMPADPWSTAHIRQPETRKALRLRAVSDTRLTHGLITGSAIKQLEVSEFIARHGIKDWRRTPSGKLGTSYSDLEALEQRPEFIGKDGKSKFVGIADVSKTVKQLHEMQLFVGTDGRFRAQIWPFSTISGRAAPDGAEYPFTTPAWCRFMLMPAAGTVLIYLDFASMEFGVAAALYQDPVMLADYAGEPYLALPILAGFLPRDATKLSHPDERECFKAPTLSLQYGAGAALLARKLNLTRRDGQRLVDLHHDRYQMHWKGSDRKIETAFANGEMVARDGWRCGVCSLTTEFIARNWFVQSNAAAIFRYAGLMMRQLGLRIIGVVHDAVLVETTEDRLELDQARAILCLERASRRFLHGFTLRVDPKVIICAGERFYDKRGERTWAFVERTLHEFEEEGLDETE